LTDVSCPSYFLLTAGAYTFLANFLEAALDKETLAELHALKQAGERTPGLHADVQQMRDLFYSWSWKESSAASSIIGQRRPSNCTSFRMGLLREAHRV
jgi:hypothetical protein